VVADGSTVALLAASGPFCRAAWRAASRCRTSSSFFCRRSRSICSSRFCDSSAAGCAAGLAGGRFAAVAAAGAYNGGSEFGHAVHKAGCRTMALLAAGGAKSAGKAGGGVEPGSGTCAAACSSASCARRRRSALSWLPACAAFSGAGCTSAVSCWKEGSKLRRCTKAEHTPARRPRPAHERVAAASAGVAAARAARSPPPQRLAAPAPPAGGLLALELGETQVHACALGGRDLQRRALY